MLWIIHEFAWGGRVMNGCVIGFGLTSSMPNVCVNFVSEVLVGQSFLAGIRTPFFSCRIDPMTCRNQIYSLSK